MIWDYSYHKISMYYTLVFNILNLTSRVLNWKENKKFGTILCFWVRIQNRNWKYFFENNNIFVLFGFKNIYANFFIFIHLTENDCTCNNKSKLQLWNSPYLIWSKFLELKYDFELAISQLFLNCVLRFFYTTHPHFRISNYLRFCPSEFFVIDWLANVQNERTWPLHIQCNPQCEKKSKKIYFFVRKIYFCVRYK